MFTMEDLPPGLHEALLQARNFAMNVYTNDANAPYIYMGLGALLAVTVIWVAHLSNWPWSRGKGYEMASKARRRKTNTIVSDMITDGLEDLELKGELSRKEVDHYYRLFTNLCKLPGMSYQRRKRTAHEVRMDIIGRRGDGPYHRPEPMPFPDETKTTKEEPKKESLLQRLKLVRS